MQAMRFYSLKFRYLLYTQSLLGCTESDLITIYYHPLSVTFYQNPSQGRIILRNPLVLDSYLSHGSAAFLCYLQQWLYTLVKEKFLSMLGSWICPIEQTTVIIQVVSQLLPRVTPEKIHTEVSHCLGLDQDTHSYTLECLWMVQLPIPAIHLWLALFFNLLL